MQERGPGTDVMSMPAGVCAVTDGGDDGVFGGAGLGDRVAIDIRLEIGIWRNAFGGWAPFPGLIDNVAFFDHARTAAQVCADSLGTWDGQACARPASEAGGP